MRIDRTLMIYICTYLQNRRPGALAISIKKIIYMGCGFLCVALGFIGIFTPLLPTTSFLLLAAFFFSRSSERFHRWLIEHKVFGPMIKDWNENKAIPLRAKVLAVLMMTASGTYVCYKPTIPFWGKIATTCVLLGCATFILTRNTARR